ncbi:dolichol-phosphate mannosyltransferase [Rippkaea orientalis PCC 8801]|uniref:Dolichol-phosphate mannosyltransferase n=1 Tax=Rippkaea orientalis (strain PCC 8801 / RF-1) TaxID=41431 RepID=B7K0N2_RIPO1|nr:hypothetical protein [Rippkaea orientalis]ACK64186.1 dolichol-phosphate mannosyltransferase [Rippkaea orientalis PCC 8801]
MNRIRNRFSWVIIAAGVLFSLFLLWQVPDGVYFSGDGGLKALLAQQLSSGQFRIDLIPPQADWVRQLWRGGFYPYEPPFAYYLNDKYYITFPFPFSLVTAPFYAAFGFRGLYLVPLLSTWTIWLTFKVFCQRLNWNEVNQSLALFFLIFTSNLTLYSAMYWEHTLAVAFCFIGMIMLLIPKNSANFSAKEAILSGFFIGLSAWVRSEFLAMVATLAFIVAILSFLNYQPGQKIRDKLELQEITFIGKHPLAFGISMFSTVGLFFICNKLIYGNFLGIHALQIVEEFSLIRRLTEAWESFIEIFVSFFHYFPIAIFSLLYLFLLLITLLSRRINSKTASFFVVLLFLFTVTFFLINRDLNTIKTIIKSWGILVLISAIWLWLCREAKIQLNSRMILFYLMGLIFTIGVALLVDSGSDEIAVGGKQWGPRYLLILLPFFTVLVVQQMNILKDKNETLVYYSSLFMVSIFVVLGLHQNLYQGTVFFAKSHQGVSPTLETLEKSPHQSIIVSHQYAAQMLESSLGGEKFFFRTEDNQKLLQLSQALVQQNQSGFIYVCYPYHKCKIAESLTENLQLTDEQKNLTIQFKDLGTIGKYPLYEGKIILKTS